MSSSIDIPVITDLPSVEELQQRINNVCEKLQQQGLDAYICHDPDNVYYLTNFANYVHERPFILVILASGELRFIAPKLEISHINARAIGELDLISYDEFPAPAGQGWEDRVDDTLRTCLRIGVEQSCPLTVFQLLQSRLNKAVHIENFVDDVRMVKSSYEIGRINYACQMFSRCHQALLEHIRPGQSQAEIHGARAGEMMLQALLDIPHINMLVTKAMCLSQPPSVSDDPHNFTSALVPMEQGGPHVSIVAGTINGYGAELERTFFLNTVPEAAKKPFNDMLEARRLAFELTVPGNNMADVDKQVNDLLRRRGYSENLLHRTGHSFGVNNHEGPFLAEGYDRIIEPNMLFSIEPGIYLPGLGGFRFSDTIVTTRDGNHSLTSAPESLESLTMDCG